MKCGIEPEAIKGKKLWAHFITQKKNKLTEGAELAMKIKDPRYAAPL
jgi:hypothetical protein